MNSQVLDAKLFGVGMPLKINVDPVPKLAGSAVLDGAPANALNPQAGAEGN